MSSLVNSISLLENIVIFMQIFSQEVKDTLYGPMISLVRKLEKDTITRNV
jgi:hypothetical protein